MVSDNLKSQQQSTPYDACIGPAFGIDAVAFDAWLVSAHYNEILKMAGALRDEAYEANWKLSRILDHLAKCQGITL